MRKIFAFSAALALCAALQAQTPVDPSLLFYLGGESVNAEYSASAMPRPNILDRVSTIDDGVYGKALKAHFRNSWSYPAPGNIWSDRGTVAFWWRSSDLINETEFPIMRVSFYDHTSWDMVWLRIDWNGHGLDAFVTDNNLARVRVSTDLPRPAEDKWMHIAFSWDESKGVKLYLDGQKIAQKDSVVCLRTGLDQLGFHQRVISPYQVQSAYIIQRGGDIDELRIYDHPLTDGEVVAVRDHNYSDVRPDAGFDEAGWKRFFGFDKDLPPYLENEVTTVRKVQIDSCIDFKRWFWKACDGLRETTWPGVYNRSRITGRSDYFQLPDWDCYSFSGKKVTFVAPEQWNYFEITGGAYGNISGKNFNFSKKKGTQRSFHRAAVRQGASDIVFTNDVQETPIQEFNLFNVSAGETGKTNPVKVLSYGLTDFNSLCNHQLEEIETAIDSRFRKGERAKLLATGWTPVLKDMKLTASGNTPVAHIIIPSDCKELDINVPLEEETVGSVNSEMNNKFSTWSQLRSGVEPPAWSLLHAGLDAIRISLPPMDVKAEKNGLMPLNIAVMDPISPQRYMFDFSFSVKPGEARTLYLDVRDRILPVDKPLYIRISAANASFSAASLQGTRIDLIFKDYNSAKAEHITDRFNQVRDNWGTLVEEGTVSRRHNKFRQWEGDLRDLLRVDPTNQRALEYKSFCYPGTDTGYVEPVAPKGVPEWAFLQLEALKQWKYLAKWYIDNRMAPNGELGGGLCDDNTLVEIYPPLAEMGLMPDQCKDIVLRQFKAVYDNGMQKGGLNAIQTDAFHAFEEGALNLLQTFACMPDEPVVKERIIEAAHAIIKKYMVDDGKGHLFVASDYLGADKMAREGTWAWGTYRGGSRLMQIPAIAALGYGDAESKEAYLKFWDSIMEYAKPSPDGKGLVAPTEINAYTGEARLYQKLNRPICALYLERLSGSDKYFSMFEDLPQGKSKEKLAAEYRTAVKKFEVCKYYNTYGAPYTDRVRTPFRVIEDARLGGSNMSGTLGSWNMLAWQWRSDEDAQSVAINVTGSLRDDNSFAVEFFNVQKKAVKVKLVPRRASKGEWTVSNGKKVSGVVFEKNQGVEITVPSGSSVFEFKKK